LDLTVIEQISIRGLVLTSSRGSTEFEELAKQIPEPDHFCWLFPFERISVYQRMLRYAIIFLIIALVAEAFGASGVAGEAAWIAHVLLIIAVIFIIISFVSGRRGPPAV
jgi:uncharacterized membrane protein YtjA (UPF0391 family)